MHFRQVFGPFGRNTRMAQHEQLGLPKSACSLVVQGRGGSTSSGWRLTGKLGGDKDTVVHERRMSPWVDDGNRPSEY